MRKRHDNELKELCQHLLILQGSMAKEQAKVKELIESKNAQIAKQNQELKTLRKPGETTTIQVSPDCQPNTAVTLDRHRPGASRLHGSFRQYKKDREKFRLETKPGKLWTSSDESSSPTSVPRQHTSLRQTLSCSGAVEQSLVVKTCLNVKGILKATPSCDPVTISMNNTNNTVLESVSKEPSSIIKSLVMESSKSDSGRESDDVEPASNESTSEDGLSLSSVTSKRNYSCSSANSSFDAADDSGISVTDFKPPPARKKPLPPPRSSMTRLTTVASRPKSILHTANPNDASKALDNLIHNNDSPFLNNDQTRASKKKRVKFHPELIGVENIKLDNPLDLLHHAPKITTREPVKIGGKHDISYFEPYI